MNAKVVLKDEMKIETLKGEDAQFAREQKQIENVLSSGLATLLYTDIMTKKKRIKELGTLIKRKINSLSKLGVEIEIESLKVA